MEPCMGAVDGSSRIICNYPVSMGAKYLLTPTSLYLNTINRLQPHTFTMLVRVS